MRRSGVHLVAGHVLLPALGTVAIVALYFTPVSVIGCATRGLLAFGVAVVSLVAGIASSVTAIRLGRGAREQAAWWILSTIILMMPALLLLGPLG